MGMAASQARFLGLTARKTNLEYEGQQINQQRTTLSNQSAAYYNDLLTMTVPTAPSVVDYTTTTYSFSDGQLANQLTSMIARTDGSYTVSYLRTYMDDNAIVSATPMIITRVVDAGGSPTGRYKVGGEHLKDLDDWTGISFTYEGEAATLKNGIFTVNGTQLSDEDVAKISVTVSNDYPSNGYYCTLTASQFASLSVLENDYLAQLQENGFASDQWVVRYVLNTSTNKYVPNFYDKNVLDGAEYNDNQRSKTMIGAYTFGSATVSDEIMNVKAYLEQDATGRYTSITIEDNNGNMLTYSLSTNTITDNDRYLDAMNQYEYDKAQYDKNIQEVNAKIEIVQAEDKNLELRLKQLDTEEKAITAEIDAVSSVIKNNVDKSFKTFNA